MIEMMIRSYYVFWSRGRRVGSVEKTPATEAEFATSALRESSRLIQRDVTGTEHWDVWKRPS